MQRRWFIRWFLAWILAEHLKFVLSGSLQRLDVVVIAATTGIGLAVMDWIDRRVGRA